ncbi:MAG: hypothetical protein ABSE49_00730 [Polyangiaceae bacterium]
MTKPYLARAGGWALLGVAGLVAFAAGCGKDSHAAAQGSENVAGPAQHADCGHSACGSNFFLDVAPAADCAAGATCNVTIKLVATGDFHINEDYPYKLKADDTPGVEFLGTDAAGKSTFSKAAGDWKKKDEKSGAMSVAFRAADKGSKTVGGTFKLSVCSAQTCQLEQQPVQATVAVR